MVCDSPRLMDLAIGLVNSVLNLPNGQVKFLEEFKLQKNCEISSAHQNVSWASWNDVWASICWLQLSQMASFKNDFLCSLKKNSCIYFSTFPYIHSFPCENRIGSQLVYYFFKTIYLISANLQVVGGKSVASGGKFYQLPPDKENTEIGAGAMRNCLPRRVAFLSTPNARVWLVPFGSERSPTNQIFGNLLWESSNWLNHNLLHKTKSTYQRSVDRSVVNLEYSMEKQGNCIEAWTGNGHLKSSS